MMKRPRRAIRLASALTLACAGGLAAQGERASVDTLERELAAAREAGRTRLAPRGFERAGEAIQRAGRRLTEDGPDREFRERLAEARTRLEAAVDLAGRAERRFAEALAAREAALEPDAAARAPEIWADAERRLDDAISRFERGDEAEAAERGDLAATRFREAARTSWDRLRFGDAEAARERAISTGAREWAAETFARGDRALAEGRAELDAGRTGPTTVAAAERAEHAFERAAQIASLADSVARRQVPAERLVLAREADLARLAEAATIDVDPTREADAAAAIGSEIRRLRSEIARLAGELESERSRTASLEERIATLEADLRDAEQRFLSTRDDLLARRQREARMLEVQALFSPREGEVLISGNEILLRLYGLTFESGSDEILPEHDALLTKVQRAIQAFEGAGVRIEGHTDGRGSPDANRTLSQRRANAIREYLLARLPISASRIAATGFGEDRPIASDDTEEGRTRNRRIEVVLTLPASGG